MSTRKRRDPRGLEPESPSLYTDEKASKKSPPPNIVDEVIARFIVTAAPLLIARLFPPSVPPSPTPPSSPYPNTPPYRDVTVTPIAGFSMGRCEGTYMQCGERYVPRSWHACPYCGGSLRRMVDA